MKELQSFIKANWFFPDNAEYEYNYENQVWSITIKDKTYRLIVGLEVEDDNGLEYLIRDEQFRAHGILLDSYEDAFFED